MQRSHQAQPVYRYDKVLLAILVASFAAAWLLMVLAMILPGVASFAGKLAVSLLLGVLATILWLDFWGYATLRGLVGWRTAHWWRWAQVIGLLIFFPVVVGLYLVRAVLESQRARANGTRQATPPTRFRTTPIGLATLLGVTLLALAVSSVGAEAGARVASAQGASINGAHGNSGSPAHATAVTTRHPGPAKGKKGRGHSHHHG